MMNLWVFEALQHQSILRVQENKDILDRKILFVLNRLLKKNVILLKEEMFLNNTTPKLVDMFNWKKP